MESFPLFAGGVPLLIAFPVSQSAMRDNGGDAGEGVGWPDGEDFWSSLKDSASLPHFDLHEALIPKIPQARCRADRCPAFGQRRHEGVQAGEQGAAACGEAGGETAAARGGEEGAAGLPESAEGAARVVGVAGGMLSRCGAGQDRGMGISNYRLADYSGVSPSMVGMVVCKVCLPGLEVAGRFCHVDNGTLAQLLGEMLRNLTGATGASAGGGP